MKPFHRMRFQCWQQPNNQFMFAFRRAKWLFRPFYLLIFPFRFGSSIQIRCRLSSPIAERRVGMERVHISFIAVYGSSGSTPLSRCLFSIRSFRFRWRLAWAENHEFSKANARLSRLSRSLDLPLCRSPFGNQNGSETNKLRRGEGVSNNFVYVVLIWALVTHSPSSVKASALVKQPARRQRE